MDDTPAIPDDVLELIFLRLDSPLCLLHAASTCKQWRRVITGAVFLRQFRSLHGSPPVAGVYYHTPRHPWPRPDFVPSPRAGGMDGRFFSLDFLPDSELDPWPWRIQDSRGSLLLLDRLRDPRGSVSCGDIVICEPLTRRYEQVDPLTWRFDRGYSIANAYLVDGESGGIGMENFRVVFRLHVRGVQSVAGILTMGSNRQQSWSNESIKELMGRVKPSSELIPGSIYWFDAPRNLVAIDRSTAEFSCVKLPEVEEWSDNKGAYDYAVTAGHDGTARVVVSSSGGNLVVFSRLKSSGEWALARRIRLSEAARDLPGFDSSVFIHSDSALIHTDEGTPVILVSPWLRKKWWFHLDIDTMEVAPAPDPDMAEEYPCQLPWPPTFARLH